MKLPKTIKIGAHNYKIEFPHEFDDGSTSGQCNPSANLIRVADSDVNGPRSDSAVLVTIVHEVLHAIDFATNRLVFLGEEGEDLADAFAEMIAQIIIDNKWLPKS